MHLKPFELSLSIQSATAGKSSLLIPDCLQGHFRRQCDLHGGMSEYLAYFVQFYLPRLPELRRKLNSARDPNWNTVYQKPGLGLKKKSFIPDAHDWELFRQAANSCGVSMCFLFTFLVRLESDGELPKIPQKNCLERNSSLNSFVEPEKLVKFSIFSRKLDTIEQILHRKLKLQ